MAEFVGYMEALIDLTSDYAKTRVVYGRDLVDFQVIQHYLVDMWLQLETSRNALFLAISSIEDHEIGPLSPLWAPAWIKEAAKFVTERAIQIHGAIGVTREHDAGLYYRQAFSHDPLFGTGVAMRQEIARSLLEKTMSSADKNIS
jgi:alkylation response protein AidB-like acyl-CoA dehydrogenase